MITQIKKNILFLQTPDRIEVCLIFFSCCHFSTMSQGILYVLKLSPRSSILTDLIKYYKLDIEISTDTESESFIKLFPLRKTPTFIGNDGFQLTGNNSHWYLFLSMIPNHDLLGDNDQEFASIIRFLSMLNQEGAMSWVGAFFRLSGRLPYNKEVH